MAPLPLENSYSMKEPYLNNNSAPLRKSSNFRAPTFIRKLRDTGVCCCLGSASCHQSWVVTIPSGYFTPPGTGSREQGRNAFSTRVTSHWMERRGLVGVQDKSKARCAMEVQPSELSLGTRLYFSVKKTKQKSEQYESVCWTPRSRCKSKGNGEKMRKAVKKRKMNVLSKWVSSLVPARRSEPPSPCCRSGQVLFLLSPHCSRTQDA